MQFEAFDRDKFHVVTMISNPLRFKSRYNLLKKFEKHVLEHTPNLWVCELQQGDRPFCVTEKGNPRHLQLRTRSVMWHKENCLNLMIQKLPTDWENVAWIDADVRFERLGFTDSEGNRHGDWVEEIIHELQVYDIVQCFETAIDLGPNGEAMNVHRSFMSQWVKAGFIHPDKPYSHYHPGFAWAARRQALDAIGGLYDRSVLGSGDRNMAMALVGKVELSYNDQISDGYKRDLFDYQAQCVDKIKFNVGYVKGSIFHDWHGRKKDRKYADRWKILVDHKYDPDRDIIRDWQGVYKFTAEKPLLEAEIKAYFGSRNEDSIDL